MNGFSGKDEKTHEHETHRNLLETLGLDDGFYNKSRSYEKEGFAVARVVEVNRNNFKISNGRRDVSAELTGKFLFNIEDGVDFPTVGDWVAVHYFDNESMAVIHEILPRKSLLKRKNSGKNIGFQLIAANIDYALIVQSANENFNLNRLERYLVMANESHIRPIVVLSKTDLISDAELAEINRKIKRLNDKYLFLPVSSMKQDGIDLLRGELKSRKTYCLLGSSGVGKTTLLNKLIGRDVLDVNAIREKDSKGKHTTSRRQLIRLASGSIFIDTPGMRELGNFSVDTGVEETFDDIAFYFGQCRFRNCSHTGEDGCAVIAAVETGEIDEGRYNNFLKIRRESEFYEMSYLEKRKKDKAFTKMCKHHKKMTR